MDFVGNIVDWVIEFLVQNAGVGADNLHFDEDRFFPLINSVWGFIAVFASGLTIIYFLLEINRKWVFEGQDMNIKSIAAPFIKLAAAIVVINAGGRILIAVLDISNELATQSENMMNGYNITWSGQTDADGNPLPKSIGTIINDNLGFLQKIIVLLPILLTFLITIIVNLIFLYKAFLYKAELLARLMFAPFALADIYSGANSNAVRYIKGTLALGIYGACLIILPKICIILGVDEIGSVLGEISALGNDAESTFSLILGVAKLCVAPIAAIGIVGAAKTITKEAVGA